MTFPWTAPTKKSKDKPKGTKAPEVDKKFTKGAVVDSYGEVTMIRTMSDRGLRVQMDFGELSLGDIARVHSMFKTPVRIRMEHYEVSND